MIWLVLFITGALIVISLILLSNILLFPRLKPLTNRVDTEMPFVSILIPARNEAQTINNTLTHLFSQDYANYEVIMLDDDSDDGTPEIATGAAQSTPDFHIINGKSLPFGWTGKNWACHQLAQAAKGEVLIFTDADVIWERGALKAAVTHMLKHNADLLTIWPTQQTFTYAERLCVSLMAFAILGYLPVIGTHYTQMPIFGAANGQCMIWKRAAYNQTGGHEAVADNILEDVRMARIVKTAGLRQRMADGNRLLCCRMYENWPDVRNGFAKNLLAGYGNSIVALGLATAFHWLLFIFPWLWLVFGWRIAGTRNERDWAAALIVLGITLRAFSAAFTHQRIHDALLMPVSVLLMTRIAGQSIWWRYTQGGPEWKGRIIHKPPSAGESNVR